MKSSSGVEKWLTEDGLTLLKAWARDGMINTEIIEKMDISEPTLYRWKQKYPQIDEALKQGKEVVDIQVENALLKRALGYKEKLLKQRVTKDGYIIDIYEEISIPPDVTAQIFWLKNRKTAQWRDKQNNYLDDAIKKLDNLLEEQKRA